MSDSPWVEFFKLEETVTAFDASAGPVYVLAGRRLYKLDPSGGQILCQRAHFQDEGRSRALMVDPPFLFLKDFCDLYILDQDSLAPIEKLVLGNDLSSDICGMGVDQRCLYLSIRNGAMVKIHKTPPFEPAVYPLSDSSIWQFVVTNGLIYAGNVNGDLLIIDAGSMQIIETLETSKQNVKSVLVSGDLLVSAAQDKKMVVRDALSRATIRVVSSAHRKAFNIVGLHGDRLYTVCYACGEIKAWDVRTWQMVDQFGFPGGAGQAAITADRLYLSARNIRGLVYVDLQARRSDCG